MASSGFMNLGPGTMFNGFQQVEVASLGSTSFPATVPLTVLGGTPSTTVPPSQNLGGGPTAYLPPSSPNLSSYSASMNPSSSKSPVWPTVIILGVSFVLLHWIFWPKEREE